MKHYDDNDDQGDTLNLGRNNALPLRDINVSLID